jgi:hypothetical protein
MQTSDSPHQQAKKTLPALQNTFLMELQLAGNVFLKTPQKW